MGGSLLNFMWVYFKINMQSAMEYRVNFLLQTIAMLFNDGLWIVFWLIFFNRFKTVSSWQFSDILVLEVIVAVSWSLLGIFFGNFMELANVIKDGKLDFYLTLPKEVLSHILTSNMRYHAFGDLLFGIIITIFFIPLIKWPLLLLFILIASTILLSIAVILGSITLYTGSSAELTRAGMFGALTIASYPFDVYSGMVKFILLTVIPVGFITGVPVRLLQSFDLKLFLFMILITVILAIIALIIFKLGIRKYESGNLINARV